MNKLASFHPGVARSAGTREVHLGARGARASAAADHESTHAVGSFIGGALILTLLAAACTDENVGVAQAKLAPVCHDDATTIGAGDWTCGDDLTVECTGVATPVAEIHAVATGACANTGLDVNDPGPYGLGDHDIVVSETVGNQTTELCNSTLTVVDTTPPDHRSHDIELWPPNHKYHDIGIGDCVTIDDLCDPNVHVEFTYGTSDEPVNDIGDGNHEPDIIMGCDTVSLRSERQGPEDGRVYTLGLACDGRLGQLRGRQLPRGRSPRSERPRRGRQRREVSRQRLGLLATPSRDSVASSCCPRSSAPSSRTDGTRSVGCRGGGGARRSHGCAFGTAGT